MVGAFALLGRAGVAWYVVRELEYPAALDAVERVREKLLTLRVDRLQTALALSVVVTEAQECDGRLAGVELALDLLGLREPLPETQRVLLAQFAALFFQGAEGDEIDLYLSHGDLRGVSGMSGLGAVTGNSIAKIGLLSRTEH